MLKTNQTQHYAKQKLTDYDRMNVYTYYVCKNVYVYAYIYIVVGGCIPFELTPPQFGHPPQKKSN